LIVDNEAGLEHISRGILPPVDLILLVSDCSRRGIQAAGRIAEMIGQLDFTAKRVCLIVNRAPGGVIGPGIEEEIKTQGLELAGVIPQDDSVFQYDADGKPLVSLPADSPVKIALGELVGKLGI
jgi:CO dehydrogenase maturation factor